MIKRGLDITSASSITTLGWIPPGTMDLSTFGWCSWSLTVSQKESHCSHTLMVLQLKIPGISRSVRIIKDLGKRKITLNASTFSSSPLVGWSPSTSITPSVFFRPPLGIKVPLKNLFVLSATTLSSFNSNWDLAFPVFSLHTQTQALWSSSYQGKTWMIVFV